MTPIESYYLAMCVGALIVFGFALGYNTWTWKRSQTEANAKAESAVYAKPQQKLAA
ncbi:MAG: hypothetical protein QM780_00785 [Hyphomicrobium sp.]|uniref:hypothetical protein n=1 Tax=Hyphomicrobium sp. TaxID=82 RepID=UPI0039E5F227